MIYTAAFTADNTALHPLIAPIACENVTIREQQQDASPVAYDVAAPLSSNAAFRKFPGESTVFAGRKGNGFASGQTLGYVQPVAGTVVFTIICE